MSADTPGPQGPDGPEGAAQAEAQPAAQPLVRPEPLAREELVPLRGPTSFAAWREAAEREPRGMQLLNQLISPHDASTLIPMLPSEDLHGFVHRIGLEDCSELLSLASGEQVRDMLDAEIWEGDTLSVERLDPWLTALMHAGPDVLAARLLDLDDAVINWIVRRSVRVVVLDDPEDYNPPAEEHVTTPDGRMTIIFPEGASRDLPTKIFLDWLMRADSELCINLLLGAEAALDSVVQEDAYRWRTARMADRGYVEYYEALAIYAPPPAGVVVTRPTPLPAPPHRWLTPVIDAEARLAQAFAALPEAARATSQTELAFVANMALSADRVEPWDLERQDETLRRLRAGLVLGLDVLGGGQPADDVAVLTETPLALVFRHGYARMTAPVRTLAKARRALRLGDDATGAVDLDALRPWAEALLGGRHPRRPDGAPIATAADLREAAAAAEALADLVTVAGRSRPPATPIGAWIATAFARAAAGLAGDGPLPLSAMATAHRALFTPAGAWTEAAAASLGAFWTQRGGADATARAALATQLIDELSHVAPDDLEPRFVSLWVVADA